MAELDEGGTESDSARLIERYQRGNVVFEANSQLKVALESFAELESNHKALLDSNKKLEGISKKLTKSIEALEDKDSAVGSIYKLEYAYKFSALRDNFKGGKAIFT